jgi:hypothetical protein
MYWCHNYGPFRKSDRSMCYYCLYMSWINRRHTVQWVMIETFPLLPMKCLSYVSSLWDRIRYTGGSTFSKSERTVVVPVPQVVDPKVVPRCANESGGKSRQNANSMLTRWRGGSADGGKLQVRFQVLAGGARIRPIFARAEYGIQIRESQRENEKNRTFETMVRQ